MVLVKAAPQVLISDPISATDFSDHPTLPLSRSRSFLTPTGCLIVHRGGSKFAGSRHFVFLLLNPLFYENRLFCDVVVAVTFDASTYVHGSENYFV